MKKTVTILFTALYLLTTSGVLVGQHLCMGRVKESALFKKVEKQCMGMPEMHMTMKDCCHDEWSGPGYAEDRGHSEIGDEMLN